MDYVIKEEDFSTLLPLFREIKGLHTGYAEKLRTFIEDVGYILRSGGSVAPVAGEGWELELEL